MNHSYLIDIVIDDLIEEYEKTKEYGYVINNPVSYALYQVWRKYDNQDIQYLRNQREDYESGLKKRKALNIYKTGIKGEIQTGIHTQKGERRCQPNHTEK